MLTDFEALCVFLIAELEYQLTLGKSLPYEVVVALHEAKKKLSADAKKLIEAHKISVKLI